MARAGEKRGADEEAALENVKCLLLDIEGTTTSISFVKDTLFPYVRENLRKYINEEWNNEEFKTDFQKLKDQAKEDENNKIEGLIKIEDDETKVEECKSSLEKNVLWQMDNDRKTGALKQLQGHIWRKAYKTGLIKGQIYDDVPKALEEWTKRGKKVYIYSSGSVEAQKLLFGYSEKGDLTKYFSGYFDTSIGLKQETESYKNIASQIEMEPSHILFLTDVVKEAEAAKKSGFLTAIVVRKGNAPLTDEDKDFYSVVHSFSEIMFDVSNKRQKLDNTEENDSVSKPVEKSEPAAELMDTSEDVKTDEIAEQNLKQIPKSEAETKTSNDVEIKEIVPSPLKSRSEVEKQISEAITELDPKQETTQEKTKTDADAETKSQKIEITQKVDELEATTDSNINKQAETIIEIGKENTQEEAKTEAEITESTSTKEPSLMDVENSTEQSKTEPSAPSQTNEAQSMQVEEDKNEQTTVINLEAESVSVEKSDASVIELETILETPPPEADGEISTEKGVESKVTKLNGVDIEEAITTIQRSTEEVITSTSVESNEVASTNDGEEKIKQDADVIEKSNDVKEETAKLENKAEDIEKAPTENSEETNKSQESTQVKEVVAIEEVKDDKSKESEPAIETDTKKADNELSDDVKVNGTTTNGTNGVGKTENANSKNDNAPESSLKETEDQNGDVKSASESSVETIKVKKVLEPLVPEGIIESDIMSPPPVAATS